MAPHRLSVLAPLLVALILVLAFGKNAHGRALQQQQPQAIAKTAASSVAGYTQAGCANASMLAAWHPFRPGYHITAPYGWLNDPHGYFKRNGLHHLFFQYNPKATAWGAPFWAHVVSTDLVHWRWLPPALLPDSAMDFNGIWSGASTITEDGTPWLSYTAAATLVPELGNFFQSQALASPANLSDPYLRSWVKSPSNPVLVQTPPGGTNFQFRDTTPANKDVRDAVKAALAKGRLGNTTNLQAPRFAWVVGTQAFCLGTAAIYTAPKLEGPWLFSGNLFNQMAIDGKLNGQCEAAGRLRGAAFGGPCNQFGSKCRMWEVVDFASVAPGVYVTKWSDQDRARTPFSTEWYVISDELDPNALKFGPAFNNINTVTASAFDTLLTGRLRGKLFAPKQLDYGSTYASKFERLDDGRLIINTWIMDSFIGCIDSCSDNTAPGNAYVKRAPFKGALQLARLVTFNPETRSVALFPIDESRRLRHQKLVDIANPTLPPGGAPLILLNESRIAAMPTQPSAAATAAANTSRAHTRQLEARLLFTVAPKAGSAAANFSVGARLLLGAGAYVDITLAGTAAPSAGDAPQAGHTQRQQQAGQVISALSVSVQKAKVGGYTPATVEGGPVPLPVAAPPPLNPNVSGVTTAAVPWALPSKPLALDIWVDHSVLEVYAMQGLGRVTSRIYPADEAAAWGMSVFGSAAGGSVVSLKAAEVWSLDNAFAGQPPLC